MKYLLVIILILINSILYAERNEKEMFKSFKKQTGTFKNIKVEEMAEIIKNKEVIIIDVRTSGEVKEGYVKGAINIDFYSNTFEKDIDRLDKSKPYVIYCRSGNRSGNAMKLMKKLNFLEVYNVIGGMGSIVQSGFPLVKNK